jgi:molybdopterin synthase catalytic subunit
MQGMIHVAVRLSGPAADAVGTGELAYALSAPAVLGDLVELMLARYPQLAAGAGSLRYAVNEEYAELDTPLAEGDEVAVIPPVGGKEEAN